MQTQHRSQPMRLNSCGRSRSFRAAFLHSTHRKCRRGGWHRKDGACKSLVAGPRQGRRLGRRRKRVCMVLLQSWPGHGSADLLRSVHQRSVQIFRPDAGPISARDKGRTLASAIRHQRTLLVLDGLESLQESPNSSGRAGQLRDDGRWRSCETLPPVSPGSASSPRVCRLLICDTSVQRTTAKSIWSSSMNLPAPNCYATCSAYSTAPLNRAPLQSCGKSLLSRVLLSDCRIWTIPDGTKPFHTCASPLCSRPGATVSSTVTRWCANTSVNGSEASTQGLGVPPTCTCISTSATYQRKSRTRWRKWNRFSKL